MHKYPNTPIELYNLKVDIEEQNDLTINNPDIVQKIARIMEKEHTLPDEFKFNYEQNF